MHALRRICHATCEPVSQLFAFTARDAGDQEYQCHIFHTQQAEEIHSCFNQAFSNEMTMSRRPKNNRVADINPYGQNSIRWTKGPYDLSLIFIDFSAENDIFFNFWYIFCWFMTKNFENCSVLQFLIVLLKI